MQKPNPVIAAMKMVAGISLGLSLGYLGFGLGSPAFAQFENVSNFSAPVTVNAFLRWGDTLWVATSGGLLMRGLGGSGGGDVQEYVGNGRVFPDLHLTALCRDDAGNLWLGSRRGYLYRRSPRGRYTVFSAYKLAGWSVTALYYYDGMVVVGADKGVSLFDPAKGSAVRNATAIAGFSDPRVNVVEASADTLFLGCGEGVAYIDSLYDAPLARRNFYYPGIWKTKGAGPVRAFVDVGDSVAAFQRPTTFFRGHLYAADTGGRLAWTVGDSVYSARIVAGGAVTALYNEGDKRLWIGTETMYYSALGDGDPPLKQYVIGDFSLKQASRVVVAPNGDVWALPAVNYRNIFWYHGVHRFDGFGWRLYGDYTHGAAYGYTGDDNALGAAFWKDGSIWVGTSGGNVKHINPAKNTVGQLILGNADFTGVSYLREGRGENKWGKCDAIAADSSGYMWFSVFDSDFGSLVCYDPRYDPAPLESDPVKARFRRFFTEPPLKVVNIELMAVDRGGRIFAYGGGRLAVFKHGGDPLAAGIRVDTLYEAVGTLRAMEVGPDGALYMAGAGGVKKIPAGALAIETVDNALNNASSMAVDDGILWIGTGAEGVISYDLQTKQTRRIDEAAGLPSNNVASVAVDRKYNRLWIATDEGISMVSVGSSGKNAKRVPLRAVPNLFSASGGTQGASQITFYGLKPKASVSVYTVNGTLAAKIEASRYTDAEWRAAWTPKKNITPGTYIAVAKPGGERVKVIIRP